MPPMSQPEMTTQEAQALLNQARVASPCDVAWASMTGDERVRHCAQCRKSVYDLSSLTALEALALIQAQEGSVCVRFWRREDGTVLTEDCPVGVRRARRRRVHMVAQAVAASVVVLALSSAATHPPKPKKPVRVLHGKVQCPPQQVMGEMVMSRQG